MKIASDKKKCRRSARVLALFGRMFLVATVLLGAHLASAYIPKITKIRSAIASANQRGARNTGLRLQVALFSGSFDDAGTLSSDGKTLLAKGELETLPSGLARIELRGTQGQVERHLMRGAEYLASRNGVRLDDPRPLLFPAFLLQASDGNLLASNLASLKIAHEKVSLGLRADRDCYVLGERARGASDAGVPPTQASFWVDMNGFYAVALDLASGARYRFGPFTSFQGVQLPQWISIEKPGMATLLLEVQGAAKTTLPAAAFQAGWIDEQTRLVPAN